MIAWSKEMFCSSPSPRTAMVCGDVNSPTPRNNRDVALLRELCQALRQPLHNRFFERAKTIEIDRRLAERDPVRLQLGSFVDHVRDVQESFRGDATHVEAHAAPATGSARREQLSCPNPQHETPRYSRQAPRRAREPQHAGRRRKSWQPALRRRDQTRLGRSQTRSEPAPRPVP